MKTRENSRRRSLSATIGQFISVDSGVSILRRAVSQNIAPAKHSRRDKTFSLALTPCKAEEKAAPSFVALTECSPESSQNGRVSANHDRYLTTVTRNTHDARVRVLGCLVSGWRFSLQLRPLPSTSSITPLHVEALLCYCCLFLWFALPHTRFP